MVSLDALVDLNQTSLLVSLLSILFNPVAWNIVAQNEYRNKTITRMFGGQPALWVLFSGGFNLFLWNLPRFAVCVALLKIFSRIECTRASYHHALSYQPRHAILPRPFDILVPAVLFLVGQTFVITSTWALGITGTFLGDYFGILMDHRVEGFPFNVLRDPMYVGSTMSFAATALWYERPAGLLITFYVYIVYVVALRYEGPFTDMIYSKREEERKLKKA
ncbi:Phosphatidyl-N-methylethanolamine N-methyltransferase [Mycena venus]|uniref:Phosphatidyl-N-methylethanolamine N-methyltransferase n=1 Tax=Mycena venus TaxID=2733690 RepID=A0A8H6XQQ7_9AGAR|nr:Phosphatidyl-N-methylethanolamine N-methyltransferase [Mycena venus]